MPHVDPTMMAIRTKRVGQSEGGWRISSDAAGRVAGRIYKMNRTMKRMALPIGAALILGSSGFAFMASNTFADVPGAGAGSVAISGYEISDLHFSGSDCAVQNTCYLNGVATAQNANAPIASDVAIKFNNSDWYQCQVLESYPAPGARGFRCDLRPGVYPGDLDDVTVVVTG